MFDKLSSKGVFGFAVVLLLVAILGQVFLSLRSGGLQEWVVSSRYVAPVYDSLSFMPKLPLVLVSDVRDYKMSFGNYKKLLEFAQEQGVYDNRGVKVPVVGGKINELVGVEQIRIRLLGQAEQFNSSMHIKREGAEKTMAGVALGVLPGEKILEIRVWVDDEFMNSELVSRYVIHGISLATGFKRPGESVRNYDNLANDALIDMGGDIQSYPVTVEKL